MAHLTTLHEEEARLPGGEGEVLARATRRLGDSAELTAQLQQTVPARDVLARFNHTMLYRRGEPVLRRALRLAGLMFAGAWLEFSLIVLLIPWRRGDSLATLPAWFVLVPTVAGAASLLTFLFTILE